MRFPRRIKRAWRELTRTNRSDYAAAEVHRLVSDWFASLKSADEEVKGDIRRLRARARELSRNNGYARKYLHLLRENVIGPAGVSMQSKVKRADGELDEQTNTEIERGWREWSRSKVSLCGRLDLVEFQKLALRTVAVDGEALIRLVPGDGPHGLALQQIDADLLDDRLNRERGEGRNEIRMGVEIDRLGRPVGYWISTGAGGSVSGMGGEREFVPAGHMLHLFMPERPGQTRGVSWLASVMLPLRMLDGYEEAELVASRIAAAKMGWFQSRDSSMGDIGLDTKTGLSMEASPGMLEQLPAGWEFVGWDPDHPTTAFPAFVKSILRKASTGLGASYNAIADDLEGVNYSSMRSGLLIERDVWRGLQGFWVSDFLGRVFPVWLGLSLLSGGVSLPTRDPRGLVAPEWTPRGWAWVDPKKDVEALVTAIKHGLGSRTRGLAEQGIDYERILDDLAREATIAAAKGVSIEEKKTSVSLKTEESDASGSGAGADE